jgi:hypothetical protein
MLSCQSMLADAQAEESDKAAADAVMDMEEPAQ